MQSYRQDGPDQREQGIDLLERRRVQAALRARLFGRPPEPVRVGRFELKGRLGAGAMGIAYVAHDPQLQRDVALKMLHGAGRYEGDTFLHEARALARLSHPNVLQIHEAGIEEGSPFLVSELVHGGTFRAWHQERPRPWRDVLRLLIEVGKGLHAAHQRGLVHRDIKPENVLIGADGRPRVADFGLALIPSPMALQATSGQIAGTLRYMAPEQMRGDRAEPASDQFSFCVMAHEALFGRLPFDGATSAEVLAAIEAGTFQPIPRSHPAAPALLALRRGLKASPAARHPSMAELLDELDRLLRRRPALWLGAVVLSLLAGSAGAAWALTQSPVAFEFTSTGERDVYYQASELTRYQRYEECAALLQKHPRSENLSRFRISCASTSRNEAILEQACADWRRYQSKSPPAECSDHVREARRLLAAGQYERCIARIEPHPYDAWSAILVHRCAAALHSIDGYFRACNYNRKAAPSSPPCRRLERLGPPPRPPLSPPYLLLSSHRTHERRRNPLASVVCRRQARGGDPLRAPLRLHLPIF